MGGARASAMDDSQLMIGIILLLGLTMISVYVNQIPGVWLARFRKVHWQAAGLFLVFVILSQFGWIHGTLAALAFALVVSAAVRRKDLAEGFCGGGGGHGMICPADCPCRRQMTTPPIALSSADVTIVPNKQRWWSEKVLGENPFLIREKRVDTGAVQDLSERNMGASRSSK